MIRPKPLTALAIVILCLAGGCGGSAGAARAAQLGPVRWRWRPPRPASVGMPAASTDDIAVTFGHTFVVSLATEGTERWRTRRLGVREETPLLTPDLVVVPADDGLVALERTTGHVRWDVRLGRSSVERPDIDDAASTPVLAGRTVVTCLSGGVLVAVDASNGATQWRAPLKGRCDGPPATDGTVAVATWDAERGDDAGVAGFDVATGRRRWTASLRPGGISAPAIAGRRPPVAVVVDRDLAAKAFDLSTGAQVWTTRVGGAGSPEVPPLSVGADRVLVADRLAGLTLLDAHGHRVWSTRADAAAVRGGPAGSDSRGRYVLPLYDGKVLVAGPGRRGGAVDAPGGLANGVAVAQDGSVLISSAQGGDNQLAAYGAPTT